MRVVVAWSKVAERSIGLARELGFDVVAYRDKFPYLKAFTLTLKHARKWNIAIIQLPPGPALLGLILAKKMVGNFYIICDVHSGMVWFKDIKQALLNSAFRQILRLCDIVVAHNCCVYSLLRRFGMKNAIIVYDPLPRIEDGIRPKIDVRSEMYVLVPASWSADEPIDYLVSELIDLPNELSKYKIVITGDYSKSRTGQKIAKKMKGSTKIILAGFLPRKEYVWLLRNAAAVVGLTNAECTIQRVFWEAAAYAKPIIAAKTKTIVKLLGNNYPFYYEPYKKRSLLSAVYRALTDRDLARQVSLSTARKLGKLSRNSIDRLLDLISILDR